MHGTYVQYLHTPRTVLRTVQYSPPLYVCMHGTYGMYGMYACTYAWYVCMVGMDGTVGMERAGRPMRHVRGNDLGEGPALICTFFSPASLSILSCIRYQ
jgi:hypothetical protein